MPSSVIDMIKDRLPIAEVLSSYITVEQSGTQYKAKCPFHNERTASFYISPDRGLYYCFGCGAKGDIFSFVSAFEGIDFKGALKLLAERAGVPLEGADHGPHNDTDPLYELLEKTTLQYQRALSESKEAVEYLTHRGISAESIAAFRIGYAPLQWRFVQATLTDPKGESLGIRVGLLKKTEEKVYDRFRGRIMFPLGDSSGRVVGFSGRLFPDTEDGPKYLNSPETELFKKSKVLFGFDKAKAYIKKYDFAILVEGQMDLVLSHQAGFKNTVAASGTAVSFEAAKDQFSNLSLLSRLTKNLVIAFDGDEAGKHAADRAALVALSLGMNPKIAVIPQGVDPADFLSTHPAEAWKEILKDALHCIPHHLLLLQKEVYTPSMLTKKIKDTIFPFLVRISSSIEQMLYIKMVADALGTNTETVIKELPQQEPSIEAFSTPHVQTHKGVSAYERLVALRNRFASEEIEQVCKVLETLSVGETLFSSEPLSEETLLLATALVEREYGTLDERERVLVARELVETITTRFLQEMRGVLTRALQSAQTKGDDEAQERLLRSLQELHTRLHTYQ